MMCSSNAATLQSYAVLLMLRCVIIVYHFTTVAFCCWHVDVVYDITWVALLSTADVKGNHKLPTRNDTQRCQQGQCLDVDVDWTVANDSVRLCCRSVLAIILCFYFTQRRCQGASDCRLCEVWKR